MVARLALERVPVIFLDNHIGEFMRDFVQKLVCLPCVKLWAMSLGVLSLFSVLETHICFLGLVGEYTGE